MSIGGVRGAGTGAVTPATTTRRGQGFGEAFRARLRADLARGVARTPQPRPNPSGNRPAAETRTADETWASFKMPARAAVQQATLPRLTTTGEWAELTRSIGSRYLAANVADVFVRQIALESGNFDPDVISGKRVSVAGAEGIAQLMPQYYPHVNRRDPVASLHAGAETMRANLQQFGGDLKMALAAYNAGAGRVREAIARHGPAWEAALPAETQTYLRTILGASHG
jgi:hypothetical protein